MLVLHTLNVIPTIFNIRYLIYYVYILVIRFQLIILSVKILDIILLIMHIKNN